MTSDGGDVPTNRERLPGDREVPVGVGPRRVPLGVLPADAEHKAVKSFAEI